MYYIYLVMLVKIQFKGFKYITFLYIYMLKIRANCGFFSNCSQVLVAIIKYFNQTKALPDAVDCSDECFDWYREGYIGDIRNIYFVQSDSIPTTIECTSYIGEQDRQYDIYKNIDYKQILPFIEKYFTPSETIRNEIDMLQRKFNIDYENTCVLFYRGNDKITEVPLCAYDDMIEKANEILLEKPDIRFLIQSDETEFIEKMTSAFPNSFWFEGHTRHMPKQLSTVDLTMRHNIHAFSRTFLAITILMSKCKYVICGTGNCSIWIAYFRGHAEGMHQFRNDTWV